VYNFFEWRSDWTGQRNLGGQGGTLMRWVIALLFVIVLELGVIALRLPETPTRAASDEPVPVVIVDGGNFIKRPSYCGIGRFDCAEVDSGQLRVKTRP
jgi:hypothetical protein